MLAIVCLGYAAATFYYAAQDRLGIPVGPPLPTAQQVRLTGFVSAAVLQLGAAAAGLCAAVLVLATVMEAGRLLPRALVLPALWTGLAALTAGVVLTAYDAFVGRYLGCRPVHVAIAVASTALWAAVLVSYARRAHGRVNSG